MVESVGDLIGVLRGSRDGERMCLYTGLGLSLTYEPSKRRVLVEADFSGVRTVRVGGPTRTISTPALVRGDLVLAA